MGPSLLSFVRLLALIATYSSNIAFAAETDAMLSVGKVRSSAELAFSKGDIQGALVLWEKVIKLEPNNENNYYKRFRIFLRQNKLREALADLNSALSIKPDFEVVLNQRAKLGMRLGQCTQAEIDFTNLRKMNAANKDLPMLTQASDCKNALMQAEHMFDRGQWPQAREYLNVAIKYADASSMMMYKRAYCSFHLGDHFEAIADTGKILKMEPDNLPALELRGNCYYVMNELDMAMNHYRQVHFLLIYIYNFHVLTHLLLIYVCKLHWNHHRQGLKYDPEHEGCKGGYRLIKKVQTLLSKAAKATTSSDHLGAIKFLQDAIAVDPVHKFIVPVCNIKIGNAYRELKQYKEAKAAIQRAIDFDSKEGRSNYQSHFTMGRLHMDMDEYNEAIAQFNKANELESGENREVKR
jgi:tetratricopeptide (TPR) repeat protein